MANLRGVVRADNDALEHALHARCSHWLDRILVDELKAAQGSHGPDTFNNHKAIVGGNDTVPQLKADDVHDVPNRPARSRRDTS